MAKTLIIKAKEAAAHIADGMTVMLGGFQTNGTAESIIDAIADSDVRNLTAICNDAGFPGKGIGKLLEKGKIRTLIASYVGGNKIIAEMTNAGTLELILVPQGTLAERIRAAGAGLGGILTPTGVGTVIAEGKDTYLSNGGEYLIELPLRADVAICQGYVADETGNVRYRGSARNFNPLMATAAEVTIMEVESIVPAGEIGPDYVETPHIYVDYLVKKEE